jgi:hypothetical protein
MRRRLGNANPRIHAVYRVFTAEKEKGLRPLADVEGKSGGVVVVDPKLLDMGWSNESTCPTKIATGMYTTVRAYSGMSMTDVALYWL